MVAVLKIAMAHDVYFLRHGETEWNKEARIQGQKDSALTALGETQAKRQGHTLRRLRSAIGAHTLWASPLGRAQQTADLAFDDAHFQTDRRLAEIYCGHWEGLTEGQRIARDPDIAMQCANEFDMYTNTPGGERLPELVERLTAFLNSLNGPAIIVSHKISLVVMRALLTGDGLNTRFAPVQGSVLQISNASAIAHI